MRLDNLTIVLHKPHYSANVGSAARAAMNMGIRRMLLVAPENWDPAVALKLGTHAAASVIQDIQTYDSLAAALEPFHFVVGTTARTGRGRPATSGPKTAADKIAQLPPDSRAALLFGPEDRGLSNEDLKYCHEIVLIPTAGFHSLNLAHAVLILSYECLLSLQAPRTEPKVESLARLDELERVYLRLAEILARIEVIDAKHPEYAMRKIRRSLSRFPLTSQDARWLLGLCRQMDTYTRMCLSKNGTK